MDAKQELEFELAEIELKKRRLSLDLEELQLKKRLKCLEIPATNHAVTIDLTLADDDDKGRVKQEQAGETDVSAPPPIVKLEFPQERATQNGSAAAAADTGVETQETKVDGNGRHPTPPDEHQSEHASADVEPPRVSAPAGSNPTTETTLDQEKDTNAIEASVLEQGEPSTFPPGTRPKQEQKGVAEDQATSSEGGEQSSGAHLSSSAPDVAETPPKKRGPIKISKVMLSFGYKARVLRQIRAIYKHTPGLDLELDDLESEMMAVFARNDVCQDPPSIHRVFRMAMLNRPLNPMLSRTVHSILNNLEKIWYLWWPICLDLLNEPKRSYFLDEVVAKFHGVDIGRDNNFDHEKCARYCEELGAWLMMSGSERARTAKPL